MPLDDGLTAFERRRAENAKANNAILNSISKTSTKVFGATGKAAVKTPHKAKTPAASRRHTRSSEAVKAEVRPTRRSARVAGIEASPATDPLPEDTRTAADDDRRKRQRVRGDLALGDMQVDGRWQGSLDGLHGLGRVGARPGVRTFRADDAPPTDKERAAVREAMGRLTLYDKFPVKDLKLTKERIYAMAFHPTEDKPLVLAGDKEGRLGIFDASQDGPVKTEDDDDDDGDADLPEPVILGFKPHARTISAVCVRDSDPGSVLTASYDTTVRRLDLEAQKSVELYAPDDADDDAAISCLDVARDDPHLVYFSTLGGLLGRYDVRTAATAADRWPRLHDGHKIGGFSLSPRQPHLVATAGLDRMLRVWDLRKMTTTKDDDGDPVVRPTLLATDAARLSVSHAAWSPGGHVATTSYDDTVRLYDLTGAAGWAAGVPLADGVLTPEHRIAHNCQTGRWVTILKPHWQRRPPGGVDKFAVANMNRFVDIYAADGTQLAQLDGNGITAVPAVAVLHPSRNWVAGGNGSGKLTLWM